MSNNSIVSVVQEIAAVVLHIALSPAGSGSIALYLPVLVEEIDA